MNKINKDVFCIDGDEWKCFRSPEFNFNYNKKTGYTETYGKTTNDDPDFSPYGAQILDIEITEICNGPNNIPCKFCYKSNTGDPTRRNMKLDQFKIIIDKVAASGTLTQIALGSDAHGTTNPEMFEMMEYANAQGIQTNLTIADVSDSVSEELKELCGAVAVSIYEHAGKDIAYNSIKKLTDLGMDQINAHIMVSSETIDFVYEVIEDIKNDPRLEKLNAIVFLGLKQKGRGKNFTNLEGDKFGDLVRYCLEANIRFGFDSCSGPAFIHAVKDHPDYEMFYQMAEPCESSAISAYCNVAGDYYPCSFTEGVGVWKEGISVLDADDFVQDVWMHPKTVQFREALVDNKDELGCRHCPLYVVHGCDKRRKEILGDDYE